MKTHLRAIARIASFSCGICVVVVASASVAGVALAQEKPVAIIHAALHPVSSAPIASGTIVFQGGRITAVGADVEAPADALVIDAQGARVVPGFVDAYCHLGLREIELSTSVSDVHEGSGPVQPQLRVQDALDFRGRTIARAAAAGVTTVHSAPLAENVIGGVTAVWRVVRGGLLSDVALAAEAALHVGLGEPPRRYGRKQQAPMTRMGTVALLREAFAKARTYGENLARALKAKTVPPAHDLGAEVLGRVLRKELPVVVRAERADDILVALRVAEEIGLRVVIAGGAEAWRVRAQLAAKKVPVIVAPVRAAPDSMERQGARLDNAALLHAAGVAIAFGSRETPMVGGLPFEAGIARSRGLAEAAALRALTLGAAEILGVAKEVGSLEVGKRADLVLVDGDPMEPLSRLKAVYVGGQSVPMRPWAASEAKGTRRP